MIVRQIGLYYMYELTSARPGFLIIGVINASLNQVRKYHKLVAEHHDGVIWSQVATDIVMYCNKFVNIPALKINLNLRCRQLLGGLELGILWNGEIMSFR